MLVLETLAYIGRNRRSNECVLEKLIELTEDEQAALSATTGDCCRQLRSDMQANGITIDTHTWSNSTLAVDTPGFLLSCMPI
jgi:hypothetical protein